MTDEREVSIEVHRLIAKSFSKEYVEAVVADAVEPLPAKDRSDSLIVINAHRVAVILDKPAHRGAVFAGPQPVALVQSG